MAADFSVISLNIKGDSDAYRVINAYKLAVTSTKFTGAQKASRQALVEKLVARKLGATLVAGKIGLKTSADYLIPSSSKIIQNLYKTSVSTQDRQLELKASTRNRGATIGSITIENQKELFIPGVKNSFSASSVKKKVLGTNKEGYLIDLDPNFPKDSKDVSDYIFNKYFTADSRLKRLFYEKASTILLATSYKQNKEQGARLIGIRIPLKNFTPTFFKAKVEGKTIIVSIKDNFQRNLIKEVNEVSKSKKVRQNAYKKSFVVAGKKYTIDYLPPIEGFDNYGLEITNSIKARPVDSFRIKAKIPQAEDKTFDNKQKFIKATEWTLLVRRQLNRDMERFGKATQPNLKNRTGQFIDSISVQANYKTNTIMYRYHPNYKYYKALEKYGYNPDAQIEGSIREVSRKLYLRAFKIVSN